MLNDYLKSPRDVRLELAERAKAERLRQRSKDLAKTVKNLYERAQRKLSARRAEQEEKRLARGREQHGQQRAQREQPAGIEVGGGDGKSALWEQPHKRAYDRPPKTGCGKPFGEAALLPVLAEFHEQKGKI